jgi:predicted ABC-type sugar transport system permease subunit
MAIAPAQKRIVGRALIGSAAVMFGLGAGIWNGLLDIHAEVRPLITLALGIVGALDLGIGLFFLRSARS